MNRRLYASLLGVMLFTQFFFLSGFNHVSAQTVDTYTYDTAFGTTMDLYANTLNGVRLIGETLSTTNSSAGKQQYTDFQSVYPKLVNALGAAQSAYEAEFSAGKSAGLSTAKTQLAALSKADSAYRSAGLVARDFTVIPPLNALINLGSGTFNSQFKNLQDQAYSFDQNPTGGGGGIAPNANAPTVAATGGSEAIKTADTAKCGFFNWTIIGCADALITYVIKNTLLSWVTIFTWMFGQLFHYSIYYGVLNFAALVPTATLLPIWQTIRDIFNLVMIFFGFGLAILYLFNKTDKLKAFIPWLLVYALFVNFSWTMSRTLVDYSNIMTLKMYELTVPSALEGTGTNLISDKSAATKIMEQMGMQTVITKITSYSTTPSTNKTFEDQIQSTPVALLFVVMAAYLAYVFLVAALVFIIREALLIFFIIFSPILLVDIALPWVGKYAQKAREIFFSQLAVGFIFMLFLYVVVSTMSAVRAGLAAAKLPGAGSVSADVGSFFGILVMLILLYIMMKAVKELSGMAGSVINSVAGAGVALATGGTAMIGRATLGAAASRFAGSAAMDRIQHTAVGRGLKSATNRVANGSMDLRNLASVQSFAKKDGLNIGTSKSEGRIKDFELKEKNVAAAASAIKDDAAREKYLLSQGKAAQLYRNTRAKRDSLYGASTGGKRREMFEKNVDLRNVALDRDRAEAEAENNARNAPGLLKDLEAKKRAAGFDEKNRNRDHGEALEDNAEFDKNNKIHEEALKENAEFDKNKAHEEALKENAEFDKNKAHGDALKEDAERGWSEAKESSGPGPIDLDPQHVKTQVAKVDALQALKGYRGKGSASGGATAYSAPTGNNQGSTFTDGKTKAVLEEIYKSQKAEVPVAGGATAYSTPDKSVVMERLKQANEDLRKAA